MFRYVKTICSLLINQTAQLAEYTGDEAFHHNGQIFIAVRSKVYDVTLGASYYGPGAAYHALAGKDATRILATMDMQEKVIKFVKCKVQLLRSDIYLFLSYLPLNLL